MSRDRIHLPDEPKPSTLDHLATSPSMVMLGMMVGSTLVGFAWFALNAFAMGSPTRAKELSVIGAGAAMFVALAAAMTALVSGPDVSIPLFRYCVLALPLVGFAVGYRVLALQSRTWSLLVWARGDDRAPGFAVAVALSTARGMLLSWAVEGDSLFAALLLL